MAETLLALSDLRAGYGEAVVLDGISLDLAEGGSLAVLGRNGVGKTTLLLTIMGFTRVASGSMRWRGRDIGRIAPHRRARLGIGWVAQEREIFPSLTVEENLTVAARVGRWDVAEVYRLFPRLAERRRNMGSHLSGGEQQMLAIARALTTNPALLLLDEPLEGLAPIIVEDRRDRAHDRRRGNCHRAGRAAHRGCAVADARGGGDRARHDRAARAVAGAAGGSGESRPVDRAEPDRGGFRRMLTRPARSAIPPR